MSVPPNPVDSRERRSISLDPVRADGWFERLGDGSPHFGDLCEAVGERVVAFAVVSGVRISSVAIDPRVRDASVIEFSVGDDEGTHELPLGELRRRLAATLVASEPHPAELSSAPPVDELQRFIGFRYVLLAPVFGISLRKVLVGGGEAPSVVMDLGAAREEVPLEDLRDLIHDRVRAEARASRGGTGGSPFAIDMNLVPKAEKHNAEGDWEGTLETLGGWPSPLSMLLRTAEGQSLTPEVKATLAHAMGLLGTACIETGELDFGMEVMRLGVQWGQESGGAHVAGLFRRLGGAQLHAGRPGQAIGLLRRALSLGAPPKDVLPLLAESYLARGRHLPAMVCAENARRLGADADPMRAVEGRAAEALGEPWGRFREAVPAPAEEGRDVRIEAPSKR